MHVCRCRRYIYMGLFAVLGAADEGLLLWWLEQALVSVSTIGTQDDMSDEQLAEAAKAELAAWFGEQHTATWELLRIYRIPFAQPNQARNVCNASVPLEGGTTKP